jgi:hypothetical protein
MFGLATPFVADTALANNKSDDAADARTDMRIVPDYRTVDPALPAFFETYDTSLCPQSGIVAFSAYGLWHVSQGGGTLLTYPNVITNAGAGWSNGGGTFVAPCAGLYYFTVSFVKDSYSYGGTKDDVYVCILQNGADKGCAWAGENIESDRVTGSYSVALMLEQGDYVQTFAFSDVGLKRHLAKFNFTGYLVRQRY